MKSDCENFSVEFRIVICMITTQHDIAVHNCMPMTIAILDCMRMLHGKVLTAMMSSTRNLFLFLGIVRNCYCYQEEYGPISSASRYSSDHCGNVAISPARRCTWTLANSPISLLGGFHIGRCLFENTKTWYNANEQGNQPRSILTHEDAA